jgi:teichoic acid transport system ATP-binding protein
VTEPSTTDTTPDTTPVAPADRPATIVLDDVHVTYRVLAGGQRAKETRRLLRRSTTPRRLREVHAVKGISLVAHEGEAIGVVGHNGSGKSTLLATMAGLVVPSSGTVWADGDPALLGVNAALINDLSGERNVVLGGLALGMTRAEVAERYQSIVDFAELGEFIEYPMRTYSSGMQARLRFAIAASATHRILLIDEALAVGDQGFRLRSEQRIAELREAAGTVFLVSHSLGVIAKTCDRVIWVDHGTLKMDGPTDEVLAAYRASVG